MIKFSFRSAIVFSLTAVALAEIHDAPGAALLDRAGQRVQRFWDDLSSVACLESLTQEKLNEKDKVVLNSRAAYDYLISLRWNGAELLVDESRLESRQPQKKRPAGSLLATRGFATMLLILHPEFQPGYLFTFLPEEVSAGRRLTPVSFTPRSSGRSPGALELKGREYPIAWEGTAWIDPSTAMIVRIQAHWKEPAPELGLEALSSDVRYTPVTMRNSQTYWLPDTALIEVKTPHQHWRNTHKFTNYRLFSVEADTKVEEIKK